MDCILFKSPYELQSRWDLGFIRLFIELPAKFPSPKNEHCTLIMLTLNKASRIVNACNLLKLGDFWVVEELPVYEPLQAAKSVPHQSGILTSQIRLSPLTQWLPDSLGVWELEYVSAWEEGWCDLQDRPTAGAKEGFPLPGASLVSWGCRPCGVLGSPA